MLACFQSSFSGGAVGSFVSSSTSAFCVGGVVTFVVVLLCELFHCRIQCEGASVVIQHCPFVLRYNGVVHKVCELHQSCCCGVGDCSSLDVLPCVCYEVCECRVWASLVC